MAGRLPLWVHVREQQNNAARRQASKTTAKPTLGKQSIARSYLSSVRSSSVQDPSVSRHGQGHGCATWTIPAHHAAPPASALHHLGRQTIGHTDGTAGDAPRTSVRAKTVKKPSCPRPPEAQHSTASRYGAEWSTVHGPRPTMR